MARSYYMQPANKTGKGNPMIKNYEAFASANKDALDAFTQFSTIMASGFRELSSHMMELTQNSIEMNTAAGKAVMTVRSIEDLTKLQSGWVNQFLGTALPQTARLSELSVKHVNKAAAPIQSHLINTLGRIGNDTVKTSSKAA